MIPRIMALVVCWTLIFFGAGTSSVAGASGCTDDDNNLECIAERLLASTQPETPNDNPVVDHSGTGNADCSRGSPCNQLVTYGYQSSIRTETEYDVTCEVYVTVAGVGSAWQERTGDGTGDCTAEADGGTQTVTIRNREVTSRQQRYGTLDWLRRPVSYYDDRELPYLCDSIPSAHYAEDIKWDRQKTVDDCRTEIEQSRASVDDGSPTYTFTVPGDDYTGFQSQPVTAVCPIWYSAQHGTCHGAP